ncbi:MAG: ATP-binding protein [Vicinamibacterales bacterium]
MSGVSSPQIAVSLALTRAISRSRRVEEIYTAAIDALARGLNVSRASILLFDPDGVMRFKASRGLSDAYRRAVEGHTPWTPDTSEPEPIIVGDVRAEASLAPFLSTIEAEGIAAMTFIPLVSLGRVIGKFMLYFERPYAVGAGELQLAGLIAAQVAFAVERTRANEAAKASEEHLRFALDAGSMGTWEWNLETQQVRWSENLERLHGMPPGGFNGRFETVEQEIHPEDRARVLAAARRAIEDGSPYEVEYRIAGLDGITRWVEGKGRVEFRDGRAVRMSGVCMDVTRRKRAEQARIEAAEEASRLKDQFLATLSHELRTPLNAILGWAQILEDQRVPPERARQALGIIRRNARLQAQLIEDILDVSRIIAGKLEIERVPLFPAPLVESALGAVLPSAAAKHIELTRHGPADLPLIEGDAKRLQQVLGNVLSNAVKFTPPGGRIDVRCAFTDQHVTITVQDSGVGIDPEFLPHAFDRFRQGDSRSTRAHDGLGLGLAIARHLVEEHHGAIHATSRGTGTGATFEIRLPVAPMPAASHGTPAASLAGPAGSGTRLDGLRILVVDDQEDSRELVAQLLAARGAHVLLEPSAAAALARLEAEPVDLTIADIAMPEIDGYDLVRRIRGRWATLPTVALSAYARPEERTRALACGFDAYCTKPLHAEDLFAAIGSVLVGHGR